MHFGSSSTANAPIPAGTIGTVLRMDLDGDIYVNFGSSVNTDKLVRTSMFDQIEAVSASVGTLGFIPFYFAILPVAFFSVFC
jgi:hypothetical protein